MVNDIVLSSLNPRSLIKYELDNNLKMKLRTSFNLIVVLKKLKIKELLEWFL